MAQLNDLLVLGNTNLLGAVNSLSTITAPTFDGNATTATTAATANKVAKALTIGAQTYNGSAAITITAKDLGLTGAMVYKGTSSTSITDGGSQSPTIGGRTIAVSNLQAGNVVLYGSQEYVWNGSTWELLGDEGSYKLKQTAVSSPAASGNATAFIDTISQDANGRIAVTKKTIPTANTRTLGLTRLHTATDCTTYTSDDGGASPAAVKKAVTLFGDEVYAKLTNPNNLIHSGNEFTFASDAFSGDIYINYRTAAGNQNGNITGYRFCQGNGGTLSSIYALAYYQNGYGVLDTRNVSGTVNKVPKFIGVNTINNSNITDDGATITLGTKVVVQGNGSSYNEGIRILPASNGWSNIFFSANTTVSGEHDGGWLIGRRGAVGSISGAIGDFTIEEQSSSGANLTIHKDGGGATLQGKMTVNGAGYFCGRLQNNGDDEGVIINFANNGWAGLILGGSNTARSVFYLRNDGSNPFWRYNNGTTTYDIAHPGKGGTIALTSDLTWGNISGKPSTYTPSSHSHSNYMTKSDLTWGNISGKPSTYTPSSHSHSNYMTDSQTVPNACNFNTVIKSGVYRYNDQSTYTNPPPNSWGQMLVLHGAGDTINQIAFDWGNSNVYLRGGNPSDVGGSGSWSSWKRMWCEGNSITGAVWNDYAECRESNCEDFGYVLMEVGDDSLTKTTERLSHFAGISSDTWGFSQGETDKAKTPIAVAGRVLVYPYQDRNNYKPGDCVCAAPGGTVDIMTREEVINWPDRIVGTVSCVPDYEEWGGGEGADRPAVRVDGRIWIKVR